MPCYGRAMQQDEEHLGQPGVEAMLGPLGTAVMRVLWAQGPSTVAEVAGALNRQQSHQLAYTTVMTILSRLHERGLLKRSRIGRGFRYWPVADEASSVDALAGRAVDAVLTRYGAAALRQFGERLSTLDPELRAELLRLVQGEDS